MSDNLLTDDDFIEFKFNELLNECPELCQNGNEEKVRRAFNFANKAHYGVKRKSGEPYIVHPIEVARIACKEIGLGATSVICGLLHDTVEDTSLSLEDITTEFSAEVASIIDGLTKIEDVYFDKYSIQLKNFEKLLLTIPHDLRIIFLKLADRLHNLRTMEVMSEHSRTKKASETLYVYAPLAHRLGLFSIKRELEDLSFKYLEPENYNKVADIVSTYQKSREFRFDLFKHTVIRKLKDAGIDCWIDAKRKSIYSTWKTMQKRKLSFTDIYNYLATRIVFRPDANEFERPQCYNIYQIITSLYPAKHDTIKDWINNPRATGYEALHMSVYGPDGKLMAVHILTDRMNDIAEKGYALSRRFKEEDVKLTQLGKWIDIMRNQLKDRDVALNDIIPSLSPSDVYVFTPDGQLRTLPEGATVLDFAFDVHTDLGYQCIGAKVNRRLVPRNYTLTSGDQVTILTVRTQKPEKEWLNIVSSTKSKSILKRYFIKEELKFVAKGESIFQVILKNLEIDLKSELVDKIINYFTSSDKQQFYYKIGTNIIKEEDISKVVKPKGFQFPNITGLFSGNKKETENNEKEIKNVDNVEFHPKKPLVIDVSQSIPYNFASCCNPIPGDRAIVYKKDGEQLIIHKTKCTEAIKLAATEGNMTASVKWKFPENDALIAISAQSARIEITGFDRKRMISDIIFVISEEFDISIESIDVSTNNNIFKGIIDVFVRNTKDLNELMTRLQKISSVDNVNRIETSQ